VDAATNTVIETAAKDVQTSFACDGTLANGINCIIEQNSAHNKEDKSDDNFCYENISKDDKKFHFYTGLSVLQFVHLFSSLGSEPEKQNSRYCPQKNFRVKDFPN